VSASRNRVSILKSGSNAAAKPAFSQLLRISITPEAPGVSERIAAPSQSVKVIRARDHFAAYTFLCYRGYKAFTVMLGQS
jgi:hypothetical protein